MDRLTISQLDLVYATLANRPIGYLNKEMTDNLCGRCGGNGGDYYLSILLNDEENSENMMICGHYCIACCQPMVDKIATRIKDYLKEQY